MRLPEMFNRTDERLAAEVERDMQAVDAALAGLPVHTDFDELAQLAVAIRDERPALDGELAAMLDERAAAGFPRRAAPGRAPAAVRRTAERFSAIPLRRLLPLAGAAASLLIVTGVAISVLNADRGGAPVPASQPVATSAGGGEQAGGAASGSTAGSASAAKPQTATQDFAPFGALQAAGSRALRDTRIPAGSPSLAAPGRHVAQTAELTLSTDPDKVRGISSSVTAIVSRYHGLVISSQTTSGVGGPPAGGPVPLPDQLPFSAGALGAEFQLRIPAKQVDGALNDLSALGLVVSRTQGTQDITGRFVSTHDRIKSLTSERDQLISQLAAAITQEGIDAINARLHTVRNQLDNAQGALGNLKQREALVPVHLSVIAKGSGSSGGGFDLGDAAHDAGRVLTVGAGVLLITLAVIGPLGLLAGLAWLATSALRRRRRERALN